MKKIKFALLTVAIIAVALFVRNKDRRRRLKETFEAMRDKYSDNLHMPEEQKKQIFDMVNQNVK